MVPSTSTMEASSSLLSKIKSGEQMRPMTEVVEVGGWDWESGLGHDNIHKRGLDEQIVHGEH